MESLFPATVKTGKAHILWKTHLLFRNYQRDRFDEIIAGPPNVITS